jgi:hypothetical protein
VVLGAPFAMYPSAPALDFAAAAASDDDASNGGAPARR